MDAITPTSGTEEPDERDEHGRREAIAAAARRAASHLVKTRARRYARMPSALDALYPGLSRTTPATLVAIAAHLVEREIRSPRRWFGFGGEVSLLNARAALLLGRARRRRAPGSDDR